jgi:hypothetical protein
MIRSMLAAAIVAGFAAVLVLGGRGHATATHPLPPAPPRQGSTPLVVPTPETPVEARPAPVRRTHRATRVHVPHAAVATLAPAHLPLRVSAPVRPAIARVTLPRRIVTTPTERHAPKLESSKKRTPRPTSPAPPPDAGSTTPQATTPSAPSSPASAPPPPPTPTPASAPAPREPASSTPPPTTSPVPSRPGNGGGDRNHEHTGPRGRSARPVDVQAHAEPPAVTAPVPPPVVGDQNRPLPAQQTPPLPAEPPAATPTDSTQPGDDPHHGHGDRHGSPH